MVCGSICVLMAVEKECGGGGGGGMNGGKWGSQIVQVLVYAMDLNIGNGLHQLLFHVLM